MDKDFSYFLDHLKTGVVDNTKIIIESGLCALGLHAEDKTGSLAENRAALDMIDRSLIVWIVAVALVTLGMLF